MMLGASNPVAIWPIVSAILALAGALGVAYAVFTSARVSKTIELYEIENKALGQSVARQTSDISVLQDRVGTLEAENKMLKNMVTGRTAIEELTQKLVDEQMDRRREHAHMDERFSAFETLMRDVLGQLKDLWTQLRMRPGGLPGSGEIGR